MSSAPTYGVGDFATELATDAGANLATLPAMAAGGVAGYHLGNLKSPVAGILGGLGGATVGGLLAEPVAKSRLSQAAGIPGAPRSAAESVADDVRTAGSSLIHGAGGLVGGSILGLLLDVAAGGHGRVGITAGAALGGVGGSLYGGISKRKEIRDTRSAETHAAANKAPKKSEPKADSGKKESKPEPKKTEEKSEKTSAARVRTVYDLVKSAEDEAPEGGAPKGKASRKAAPKVDEPITESIKRNAGNVYNNVSNEVKRQAGGLYSGLKDAFGIEPDEIGKAERLANQSAIDVNKATQKVNKRTWTDAQRASIDKRLLQERAKAIYNRGLAANARLKAPIARRHPLLAAGLLGYGALSGISSLLGGGAEKEAGVALGRLQKAAAVVECRRTMQKHAALNAFTRAYQLLQKR